MTGKLFCFGLGYSAKRLAGLQEGQGFAVTGTSREGGEGLILFDRNHPLDDPVAALEGVSHVLVSIPPDEAGDVVADLHGQALAALPGLKWLGYLSTTGVYGDRGGDWVSEDDTVKPQKRRGRRRAAAEDAWLALHRDSSLPLHIFRLAGIYGPGRSALKRAREGAARRIHKEGHVFSRVHVDDIAGVLAASMARPNPGAIYNVVDDEPAPQADVVALACELAGVPVPPLESVEDAGLDAVT